MDGARWSGARSSGWSTAPGENGLRGTAGTTEALYGLLEEPGACQCPWSEQERLWSVGSPAMADGGLGFTGDEARGRNRAGKDGGNDQ